MASSIALKRLVSSNLLRSSLRPVASSFGPPSVAPEGYDRSIDVDRRFDLPHLSRRDFSIFSARRMGQIPNIMQSQISSGIRSGWDGECLKIDTSGMGKENIKCKEPKESGNHECDRRYLSRIELPEKLYKNNGIKGEMNNGGLFHPLSAHLPIFEPQLSSRRHFSSSEVKAGLQSASMLRPLSPHLPIYKPMSNSTSSIFNRISGAFLSGVTLVCYFAYLKTGLICLTYENFYQLFFYSAKLIPVTAELTALAFLYHLYMGVRHLVMDYTGTTLGGGKGSSH